MQKALVAVLALAVSGCTELNLSSTADGPTFEEWLATKTRTNSGRYLIQGDIVTRDDDFLRRLYDQEVHPGQGLAIHLVDGFLWDQWDYSDKMNITFCIASDQFTQDEFGKLVDAIDVASAGWESAADIDIRHVPNFDGPGCRPLQFGVAFDVRFYSCVTDPDWGWCGFYCVGKGPDCVPCVHPGDPTCTPPFAAVASYPSNSRSERSLLIGNSGFFGQSPQQLAFSLRHELGHILGFVHEFARNDVTNNLGCDESDDNQSLTPPDLASVLMYGPAQNGNCSVFNGVTIAQPQFFSELDMRGVSTVYGTTWYDVVRPNIAESYAPGSVPGDYDGDGVTDLLIRSGRAGNIHLFPFPHKGSPFEPDWPIAQNVPVAVVRSGYGNSGTQLMPGKFHDTQYTDFAIKEDSTGTIRIDYGYNGLNGFEAAYFAYGFANAKPVPADYDGDGLSDLSIKGTDGAWLIDYSSVTNEGTLCAVESRPCFGGWNDFFFSYGDATAIPVPADYDGDHRADLAIKNSLGEWNIDFSNDCVRPLNLPCFGAFNVFLTAYGFADAAPIPADYNGDGHADLAIKTNDGFFAVDFWQPTFPHYFGWDLWPTSGYGDPQWVSVPGKYHYAGDVAIDMAIKRRQTSHADFNWFVDYATDAFGTFNVIHRTQF